MKTIHFIDTPHTVYISNFAVGVCGNAGLATSFPNFVNCEKCIGLLENWNNKADIKSKTDDPARKSAFNHGTKSRSTRAL